MGSDSNGCGCLSPGDQWLDIFALVIYIPDPLGRFFDNLRRDLVPGCNPHAHVSVLPPRPLGDGWEAARERARAMVEAWPPFEVKAAGASIFPATGVVYIEIGEGERELRRMHRSMNTDLLGFEERFEYHPHITLAQGISGERVAEAYEIARRRWREYDGPRSFLADRAVFVRNTLADCWADLASLPLLGAVEPARR